MPTRKKASEKAVTADVAAAAVSQVVMSKMVVCAFPGSEAKMRELWSAAVGDYPFKVITTKGIMEDIQVAIIDQAVEDNFVLVPANCIPSKKLNRGELWLPVVYIDKSGKKTYNHGLPMQFNRAAMIDLLTAKDIDITDEEDVLKRASKAWTPIPVEVGYTFGNFVTPVRRGDPCEHKVIEALVRKKYITTNEAGWSAIQRLFSQK